MMSSAPMTGPVFLVGLPRSGSTLLSRILNDSPQLLLVNDLYFLQEVDALGAFEELGADSALRLAAFLLDKLRRRSAPGGERELVRSLLLSPEALDEITRLAHELAQRPLSWDGLLGGILSAAAAAEGKERWGYNTPQDFLHVEALRERFSGARFLFLVRDPHDTLRSYKNVSDDGNDRRRYHPLVQGAMWRLCVRRYLEVRDGGDVLLVRYEDLTGETAATIAAIETFLGISVPVPDLAALGTNTSYRGGASLPVSETELWLCDRVTAALRPAAGYGPCAARPRLRDLPALAGITLRSAAFHLRRAIASRDARARLARGLGRLLRRGS